MRTFLVDRVPAGSDAVLLEGDQARHLARVMRLGPGAVVTLIDGAGGAVTARIEEADPGRVRLRIMSAAVRASGSSLRITLCPAVVRPAAVEKIIVMASELGVMSIVPVLTKRSRAASVGPEKLSRWRRLASESAKQCGRLNTLHVCDPVELAALDPVPPEGWRIVLDPAASTTCRELEPAHGDSIHVLVGPEGGFDGSEMALVLDRGFRPVGLGPWTLRTETAAVAVAAILQGVFGDMANPPRGPA